ncbi:MAG: CPBP family intramembrane metalloprotease [Bacteroidales bacterium]|nr:CPBP family intramembrane metalloprotease [Bacteroidales bacterium]
MNLKNPTTIRSFIILLTFLAAYCGFDFYPGEFRFAITGNYALRLLWIFAWWAAPTLLITGLLFGFRNLPAVLGLNRNPMKGLAFAAITGWAMLMSLGIIAGFKMKTEWMDHLRILPFGWLMEEYLFRGFLFGILFRKVGWGFIPAGILGAIFFGMIHTYQGSTITQQLIIFLVTTLVALWLSWLYIEWNTNLWVPIFMHILMNLPGRLFDFIGVDFLDFYTIFFKSLTIAISVFLTIRRGKRSGFRINVSNLWTNAANRQPGNIYYRINYKFRS